jgi:hypothetical protein
MECLQCRVCLMGVFVRDIKQCLSPAVEKLPGRIFALNLLMGQSYWPADAVFSLFTDALWKIGALLFYVDCIASKYVTCI